MEGVMKKSIGAKAILFPTPALVVGTYDRSGKPNLMTSAWGGICCSDPPCMAISLRKATYTYGNVVERKAFTINILSETQVKEVNYYGLTSGRNEDKFSRTGITAIKSDRVDAPYGQEFPLVLECKLRTFWLLFAQEGPSIPQLIGPNLFKSLIHPCFFP